MYTRISTTSSTTGSCAPTERLKKALSEAEAVLIGAGAGLSAAAGFTYSGARFQRHFADFARKYSFQDMYSGGFYPFDTPEENWAYWSRYIFVNRYMDPPVPVYEALWALVRDKEHFVLTTNVDHCFQKAGFDKQRLFYTQGDFGLFQCSGPCRTETFDNEDLIREMVSRQKDLRVPSELIPVCPHCGRPLIPNLRADDKFVEDAGWHAAAERYAEFLRKNAGKRLLLLELGVGYNTPGIIKYPFWKMTLENPRAVYACVNNGEALCPPQIESRAICINGDIAPILEALA